MAELKNIEERTLRKGDINLRLLINHSHGNLRFMDYRVGNYLEKRNALDQLAKTIGLRKIFTLVEKQDSNNWRSVGFSREGVYPTFFRTADAYAMSRLYDEAGDPLPASPPLKPQADELTNFPGRKLQKPDDLYIESVPDERSRTTVLAGLNGDLRTLPFSRIAAPDVMYHAKLRKKEGWACAEIDDSFGHATLGFAPVPQSETDLLLNAYAGNSLVADLTKKKVNNIFGISPTTDRWSNELFAGLGFKVTGRLADHIRTPQGYSTALIWHLRLIEKKVHEGRGAKAQA